MEIETIKARGSEVVTTIKKLIKAGNVRRITIKQNGKVLLNISVTLAVVGAVLAPALAALSLVIAFAKECSIEIEYIGQKEEDHSSKVQNKEPAEEKKE